MDGMDIPDKAQRTGGTGILSDVGCNEADGRDSG